MVLQHLPSLVEDDARLDALASYAILDTPNERCFDDIVRLACQLCQVPVSLVSLVGGDRQWFKARVNFPSCETDLNSSVCAHALAQPDEVLVIPDRTADPRTRANPLPKSITPACFDWAPRAGRLPADRRRAGRRLTALGAGVPPKPSCSALTGAGSIRCR
jgi:GAF domain-containing protein